MSTEQIRPQKENTKGKAVVLLVKPSLRKRRKAASKARKNNTAFSNRRVVLKVDVTDDDLKHLSNVFTGNFVARLKVLTKKAKLHAS